MKTSIKEEETKRRLRKIWKYTEDGKIESRMKAKEKEEKDREKKNDKKKKKNRK